MGISAYEAVVISMPALRDSEVLPINSEQFKATDNMPILEFPARQSF
jgi:hypothetical protein